MATFEHFYKSLSPNSQVRGKEFEKLVKYFLQINFRWIDLGKRFLLWEENLKKNKWMPDFAGELVFENLIVFIWELQLKSS